MCASISFTDYTDNQPLMISVNAYRIKNISRTLVIADHRYAIAMLQLSVYTGTVYRRGVSQPLLIADERRCTPRSMHKADAR